MESTDDLVKKEKAKQLSREIQIYQAANLPTEDKEQELASLNVNVQYNPIFINQETINILLDIANGQ